MSLAAVYTTDVRLRGMVLTVYTLLSLAVLRCAVAAELNTAKDPLVFLYAGSEVADCRRSGSESTAINNTLVGNYTSLQDALLQATSVVTNDTHYTLCLRSGGIYYITSPIVTSRNLSLVGAVSDAENDPRIYCNYQPSDVFVIHTLYFNRSDEVRLEQLYFEGCAYPFRLELVKNVQVSHCTFR